MKYTLLLFCFICFSIIHGTTQTLWTDIPSETVEVPGKRVIVPESYRIITLDTDQFQAFKIKVPQEEVTTVTESAALLQIPNPDGGTDTFRIVEYAMMEKGLADRFPEIRTYRGIDVRNARNRIRLDWTARGFRAMVRTTKGAYFIDPYFVGNREIYQVYHRKDYRGTGEIFNCLTKAMPELRAEDNGDSRAGDCEFRSYRLALATTGEYANYHGANGPEDVDTLLAEVITAINRVNEVYEADVTVRMLLIENTDDIFYYNGATDPYTNGNGGSMLGENQVTCDNVIGSANYDIGHVFSTGGGGVASLGVPCVNSSKARGVTGLNDPINDPFYIDYVAHEMGHQFGANHTQYNNCNRVNATAMEPGSASTIMGYAGICAPNVQSNSDAYFHAISIQEISNYISNGFGNTCDVPLAFTNTAPVLDPVMDYTIPVSTPFALTTFATDAEGDSLSFCWEQWDNDGSEPQPPESTNTQGPMFRSLFATSSPTRYFPNLDDLVDNVDPTWEELPSVSRNMEFRITVRDYHVEAGCTDEDNLIVTSSASAGPFQLISPNGSEIWTEGEIRTIAWDVANTDQVPVNCASVDILLSYDGGLTYPETLATQVANDGNAEVVLPEGTSTECRVMVRSHGNIFFDISNADFEIQTGIPGFLLFTDTSHIDVCTPGNAIYEIDIASIGGFVGAVSFNLNGLPAGATHDFEPNPAFPGNSTLLSVGNLAAVTPGTYEMTVKGIGGTGEETLDISMTVYAPYDSSDAVFLYLPPDGEIEVELQPYFSWARAEGTIEYQIEIARDDIFSLIAVQETTPDTNFQLPVELYPALTYYWRVRPLNACDPGPWSEVWSFETRSCVSFHSDDVPIAIPFFATTIQSELEISQEGTISDVNVIDLTGSHTAVGDLTFTLVSPGGTEVLLVDEICGDNEDWDFGFDDDATTMPPCPPTDGLIHNPVGSLADMHGEDITGTWILEITDNYFLGTGELASWGIELCWQTLYCDAVVTTTEDMIQGSLREVIACAADGDSILFDPSLIGDTIALSTEPVIIDKDITLFNPEGDAIFINGNFVNHAFEITAGKTVRLKGLHILAGKDQEGGGFRNWGNLLLNDVSITRHPHGLNTKGLIQNFQQVDFEGDCNFFME